VRNALVQLGDTTPYGFGFWVGEILIGIVVPVLLFLLPKISRRPGWLVLGAFCAMIGVVFNRWDVTVSGLIIPLSYSPGTAYQSAAGVYWPSLPE
jgi:Ni/Fe-hydrogenase subunit HybB-like protein